MQRYYAFLTTLLLITEVATSDAVDLSIDLETDFTALNSPGAAAITATAFAFPQIRTTLVVEHGKIVAEYVRDDVDPTIPFQVWSTTKSWISLLFGFMVEDGLIALDETLDQVFRNDSDWPMVTSDEVDFKKNVTIHEMLSMSSGLTGNPPYDPSTTDYTDGGDAGGASLADSLALPELGEKGVFSYLSPNNIMSYVIQRRTGMSPREYANLKVFPALGIQDPDVGWWQNANDMEYAYHGLELTAHQMAKFGLLYLQGGQSATDKQLISQEWIVNSTSPQIMVQSEGLIGSYGYLFWLLNGAYLGIPNTQDFVCALGQGGQDVCIHPGLDRVIAQQTDYWPRTESFILMGIAFDKNVTFDSTSAAASEALRVHRSLVMLGLLSLASCMSPSLLFF